MPVDDNTFWIIIAVVVCLTIAWVEWCNRGKP